MCDVLIKSFDSSAFFWVIVVMISYQFIFVVRCYVRRIIVVYNWSGWKH